MTYRDKAHNMLQCTRQAMNECIALMDDYAYDDDEREPLYKDLYHLSIIRAALIEMLEADKNDGF
jgi:hypothetical protein